MPRANGPSNAVARRSAAVFEGVARSRLSVGGQPADANVHAFTRGDWASSDA